jgi:hypothetical protein
MQRSGNIRYSASLYYEGVPAVAFWADPPAPPVLDADRGATQDSTVWLLATGLAGWVAAMISLFHLMESRLTSASVPVAVQEN